MASTYPASVRTLQAKSDWLGKEARGAKAPPSSAVSGSPRSRRAGYSVVMLGVDSRQRVRAGDARALDLGAIGVDVQRNHLRREGRGHRAADAGNRDRRRA